MSPYVGVALAVKLGIKLRVKSMIKGIKSVLLSVAALAVMSGEAQAYGKTGHRVVGEIAELNLTDKARKAIKTLLDGAGLAEVSNYADENKSNPAPYWRTVNQLHYINVDEGKEYDPDHRHPKGDMLSAFDDFVAIFVFTMLMLGSPSTHS